MEKRFFETIGSKISLLGFGLMRLPKIEEDKQDIDVQAAKEMIDLAIRSGVNYFDTAWPYHNGLSEMFVGDTLSVYPRQSYYLADKLPVWKIKSIADAEEIFSEQLKKCKVDYFDFYLAHALNAKSFKKFQELELYNFLSEKKQQGLIRNLGFSFHDAPRVLKKIMDGYTWDFVQLQINYLDWVDIRADYNYKLAVEHNLPVIVMEPVRGGALAALNPQSAAILKGADPQASLASWALRYAASLPQVLTVLSGMSDLGQVEDNLKTFRNFSVLSDAEKLRVDQAAAAYREFGVIPCTDCKYCMDCGSGVDIPAVFALYNQCVIKNDPSAFMKAYMKLDKGKQAASCVGCNVCKERCPQKIDIPAQMQKVDETVARYRKR